MTDNNNLQRIENWCNNLEPEVIEYDVVEPELFEKPFEDNTDNWQSCYGKKLYFNCNSNKVTDFCVKYPIGINYEKKDGIVYIKYNGYDQEIALWFGSIKMLIMMHKIANTLKIKYEDDYVLLFFSMKTLLGDLYKFPDNIYFYYNDDDVIDISYCYSDIYKEYTKPTNILGDRHVCYYNVEKVVSFSWFDRYQPIAIIVWTNKSTSLLSVDITIQINNKKFYKTINSTSIDKYYTKTEIGYYVPMNIVTFNKFSECLKKSIFPEIIDFSGHKRYITLHFADVIAKKVSMEFIHKKMNT